MKYFFGLMLLLQFNVYAQTWKIGKGEAEYTVSHTVKKVTGKSVKLQGQIKCESESCEFLVAAPVKSFESSDSNRDLNMLSILEANMFPLTIAKGKFPKTDLSKANWDLPVDIDFHGVKKNYIAKLKQENMHIKADLNLDLEAHKVERPSLFTIKIKNEVPLSFDMNWVPQQ